MKEERVAECLMSWGRLLQMWGPKCEKVRKPWVLRLKRWSLSMRVSDEERREREETKLLMWQSWCEGRKKIRLIVMIVTDKYFEF